MSHIVTEIADLALSLKADADTIYSGRDLLVALNRALIDLQNDPALGGLTAKPPPAASDDLEIPF